MDRISYMRTKQGWYSDMSVTQDLEPRYVFTRQNNGKYKGEMVEGGKILNVFGDADDNGEWSDLVGEFTLDDIQKKIGAYKDPITLFTVGTDKFGKNAHYFIQKDADKALKSFFNEAKAITQVGDVGLAVKFRAALEQDQDIPNRTKDALGLYISAVNSEDRSWAMLRLTEQLHAMGDTMTTMFTQYPGMATNIKNVLQEQINAETEFESKTIREWLDVVQKAEPILPPSSPPPKMQQKVIGMPKN